MKIVTDRDARIYLLRVAEHPAPRLHAYVAERGAIQASADIREGIAPAEVRQEIRYRDSSIAGDLRHLDMGLSLLTPDDPNWPHSALDALDQSEQPFALWQRGSASLAELIEHGVTITGARAASSYGVTVAADFARSGTTGGDGDQWRRIRR